MNQNPPANATEPRSVDQQQACSPEVAAALYAQLEYYFEYAPTTYGMSRERYEATAEGKRTKAALEAYRKETGAEDTYAGSMFRENAERRRPDGEGGSKQ